MKQEELKPESMRIVLNQQSPEEKEPINAESPVHLKKQDEGLLTSPAGIKQVIDLKP